MICVMGALLLMVAHGKKMRLPYKAVRIIQLIFLTVNNITKNRLGREY